MGTIQEQHYKTVHYHRNLGPQYCHQSTYDSNDVNHHQFPGSLTLSWSTSGSTRDPNPKYSYVHIIQYSTVHTDRHDYSTILHYHPYNVTQYQQYHIAPPPRYLALLVQGTGKYYITVLMFMYPVHYVNCSTGKMFWYICERSLEAIDENFIIYKTTSENNK